MNQNPSLNYIRISKTKLIQELIANQKTHRATFEAAMEGYRQKAVELLEAHIERIKDGAPERVNVQLPMPDDHTDDYSKAIDMLRWSEDEDVWLTAEEFDSYVRDNWFWKPAFLLTASTYGA